MMINKRLIGMMPESKKHIQRNVAFQWLSLLANMALIFSVADFISRLYSKSITKPLACLLLGIAFAALLLRFFCTKLAARESFLSSKTVKGRLRRLIYEKLLRLGSGYRQQLRSSEVVQVAVEGVDQLETYFGSYLPQFFYSMLAPLTLFVALSFVNLPAAAALFLCVPLIPVTIAAVQTIAKKLLSKYWNQYTALGDSFLENLQGLTTLKIYKADGFKHQQMNEEAEHFRKITMKVLTMQLNSITIMDLVAYGGAALGMIVAALQFQKGAVSLGGGIAMILLAADFFIPMRMLGSYFHIAMNGMAASDKIFKLLDLEEPRDSGRKDFPAAGDIRCEGLRFSYEEEREILHGVDLTFPANSFTSIVGESGSGKSTIASILMGRCKNYFGTITIGGISLQDIRESSLLQNITYVGFDSYLLKGTVAEELRMADPDASDERLWEVLKRVRLSSFLRSQQGLDTPLQERGSNLSGGQRQRLALARAILHDSPVYIFDEATSNVDPVSEEAIMEQMIALAKTKTVLLITHRLANAASADRIYVLDDGRIMAAGTHAELLEQSYAYKQLWDTQYALEHREKEAAI